MGATMISPAAYLMNETDPSPQTQIKGWNTSLNFRDDMHNLYVQGFCSDVIANSIADVLFDGLLGYGLDDNMILKILTAEFKKWCKDYRIPVSSFPRFSLRTIGLGNSKGDYPELSSKFKGAITKTLVMWLAHKMTTLCVGDSHSRLRTACVCAMAQYTHILDHQPLVVSHQAAAEASKQARMCLRSYMNLTTEARAQGKNRWKMRPKAHYWDHTARRILQLRLNPRILANWHEESMLGKLKNWLAVLSSKCPTPDPPMVYRAWWS